MDLFIRTIGLARAHTKIGLANLAYNMKRLIWLQRMHSQNRTGACRNVMGSTVK